MKSLNEVQHQFLTLAFDRIEPALLNANQREKLESMALQYKSFQWLSDKQMSFIQKLKYKTDAAKREQHLKRYGSLKKRRTRSVPAATKTTRY